MWCLAESVKTQRLVNRGYDKTIDCVCVCESDLVCIYKSCFELGQKVKSDLNSSVIWLYTDN